MFDITTKKPISKEGIEQLETEMGLPENVDPDSPIGRILTKTNQVKKEGKSLSDEFGVTDFLKQGVKGLDDLKTGSQENLLDKGVMRSAVRYKMLEDMDRGILKLSEMEEAVLKGDRSDKDILEVWLDNYGTDAYDIVEELAPELRNAQTPKDLVLKIEQNVDARPLTETEKLEMKANTREAGRVRQEVEEGNIIPLTDKDPEEFAKGGRVGYEDGGPTKDEYGIMSLPSVPSNPNSVNDDIDRVAQLVVQSYKMGPEEQMNNKQIAYDRIEEIAEQISYGGNIDGVRSNLIDYFNDKVQEYQNMIEEFSTGGRVGFQIGGPAYDATDPIYGSSAITVTPDTIMGPQGNQIQAQTGVNPLLQRIQSGVDRAQNIFMNQAPNRFIDYLSGRTEPVTNLSEIASTQSTRDAVNQGILGSLKRNQVTNPIGAQNFLVKNTDYDGYKLGEAQKSIDASSFGDFLKKAAPSMGGEIVQFFDTMLGSPQDQIANTLGDYTFQYKPPSYDFDDDYMGIKDKMDFPTTGFLPGTAYDVNVELTDADTKQKIREQLFKDPNQQPTFDRKATIERILKNIEPTFNSSQYSPLDLDYLKSLSPSEIKDELDAVYLEGRRFRDADYSSGRIGGGNPFFRYGPQYMEQFNIQGGPLQLSSQNIGYGLRKQLGELSPLIGEEALKSYTKRLDDSLIDYYRTNFTGDTDFQKSIFGIDPQYLNNGGRVGYAYGSGLKLIQILQKLGKNLKTEIKKAVDDLIPSGDPKLDADMAVDNMLEDLNIDRDAIDQYDVLDAYGLAYDELKRPLLKEIEKTKSLAPKMIERFELKEKYPGIDDKLLTQIIDDPDPQRKAEVLATIDQAFELMRQGKSQEEVLDIMKQMTDRTKQAGGGLSYLSGF
jgi:hypothetical protein